MWNLLPLDITEADIPTSSMNDQTTFQGTSGAIKPNGLVQPSAQECSQTPVAASKARRSFLLHSPQSSSLPSSSTGGDPRLGWRPHTYIDWATPSLISTQNSSHQNEQLGPILQPQTLTLAHSTALRRKHTATLPDKPTLTWCNADNLSASQDNRHDTNETPLFRDTVKSSNALPLFNYKSGLAYSRIQGKIKRCIK